MQSSETVQKAINKANSDLKNYEENYTEEELSRKLKDDGYESLDQVKSIANGEREGLLSIGKYKNNIYHYITKEDVDNYYGVTPEDKERYREYDSIFKFLQRDYQDRYSFWGDIFGGGLDIFEGQIELSSKEKAIIIDELEKNPRLKKDMLSSMGAMFKEVDISDKNEFLQNVKNRILNDELKRTKLEESQAVIDAQNIENEVIKLENDAEKINESSSVVYGELDKYSGNMDAAEQEIKDIDETYLPDIIKEMDNLKESAQTNPEDRQRYLDLYEKGNELLSNRQAFVEEYERNRKEYNQIINSEEFKYIASEVEKIRNKQQDIKSRSELLQKRYDKINKDKIKSFSEAGYVVLDGILNPIQKDVYAGERLYNEWMESFKDSTTLDAGNTLVQGGLDIVKNVYFGFPAEIARYGLYSVENALYGKKGYLDDDRASDVFGRVIDQFMDEQYLPVATRVEGMWDGGFTYRNTTKSIAELLPFTVGIITSARKSIVTGPKALDDIYLMGKNFGKKGGNQKLATQIAITKYTHKALLHDQIKMAEELGLNEDMAFVFGNATSFMTALSQLIMPDQNFLNSSIGKEFTRGLAKNLLVATTLESAEQIVYNSVRNYIKEFGEELIDAGFQDLAKFTFVANHSSEFMNSKNIADIAMGTLFLSGSLQTVGNIKTIKAVKNIVYADFQNNGEQVIATIKEMQNDIEIKIQKTKDSEGIETGIKNTRIAKLEKQLEELKKSELYARSVLNAKRSAPIYASTEHIDLIVQKNELIESKKNLTGEELNEANKKIKEISKKLESTAAYERYLNDQKKDRKRLNKKLKESGENVEVYESYSNEEVAEIIEINLLEESENVQAAIDQIEKDENGNAKNEEESKDLDNFKSRKKQINESINNIKSTEEQIQNERRAAILVQRINKIDKSGNLTRKIRIEEAIQKNRLQFEFGLKNESEFKTMDIQLNNLLSDINEDIKNENIIEQSPELSDLLNEYDALKQQTQSDVAFEGYQSNAFITEDVSGKKTIVINKQQSLQSGFINSGQHEFLHYTLKNTLKNDPVLQQQFAEAMMQFANENPGKVSGGGEFNARIGAYSESEQVYEEYLTLMAEALVRKDVKYSNSFLGKMKDVLRRFKQRNGMQTITFRDVKDDGGESVINFLRDFNSYFKSNKKNKAFDQMIREGAKGDLTKKVEKQNQDIQEKAYGPGFSKSLKFQFSKNPDLKDDFDNLTQNEDGTKRWDNKKDFQNSPEYWEGLTQILTNPQLESLIKEGIGGETGIQYSELDDFVEKVKVKLQRRYEGQTRVIKDADGNPIVDERGIERRERVLDENGNPKGGFDPSMANGSLFGWLIGGSGSYTSSNLYRARGDVMNEYKQEIETISADTEGTARKISQIPSDNDVKQETKNEVERNKIDLLKLPVVDKVSDKIKSKVKPVKGDGHKEIISKHAGEVGQLIFDIPGDKIVKGGANLTAVTKYEEGMPIPGEAQNIQRVFNAPQFAEKFIKTLPLYNIVERTGDINLKGENLDVSRSAFGVAIGLKGLPMNYFYEDYIDPKSLSKDPIVKAESITSPKGRSKGLTTQTQVKKLKQQFINPTPETIEKFKRDIGLTPKFEANEYNRDIGQLQKGVAKVVSMNVSLSAAQRNLETKLNKAIKEGKSPKIIQQIKQQTADITGAQSKIAFSKDVADQKNRLQFNKSTPVEQLSNAEMLEQQKSWKKIVERNGQVYLDMRNPMHNNLMREWVVENLSKRLPKAFFLTSGTFDGAFDRVIVNEEQVGYAYTEDGVRLTIPRTQLLNSTLEETKAMFPEGHIFGKDDADISVALTRVTQNKKNLEDTNAKLQRAIGFKKILNVLNQMIQEDKANIPYVAALLSSTSSQMNHFMRKGSIYEFRNTLKEANREEHTQAASDFGKFILNRMIDGTFDKYIDVAMQAYFQGSLPVRFDNLLKDPAGEFSYKNNAGIYTKQILVGGKPVWIRYFNPDVNKNQGGINPNVLVLANGNTIAQEYGVGVDKSLYNHDEVVSKQQELLFQIFNGDITQEVANKTINEYTINFSKVSPSSEVKKAIKFSKAIENARKINHNTPSRGMSAWDFDDTLATTKSGVRATVPNPDGTPQPNRKVIFLAGGAGSGKSNVVKKLGLEEQGFKIVNSDISLEWLKKNSGLPENMNDLTREQLSELGRLQAQSRRISKGKMMKYQGNADGVVVDGTGGSIKAMQKLVNEFKEKGYDVSMVFVETSLETALDRNRKRKERSLLDKIVIKNHEAVQGNKEGFKEMFGERFMEVKTDNLTQADPMPADLTQQMNDFVSSYKKLRLDAEQFATQGADILEQGGVFDFSEFNVVTEGAQGPMFKTAFDRAQKYGTKDTYVLTARPAESAGPIQQFLASQGLNIPLENITGLGNSTGEAKAEWILEKFSEGYNDIYFADDAMQNVEAVKDVLDQLDIKSEVVQAKMQFSRGIDNKIDKMFTNPAFVESKETISINNVSDVNSLTRDGVYSNIQFSKKHRSEYESLISKNRPDLVKEGLVSQTVDQMFELVDGLSVPANKKRKYEQIMTKWLATSVMKLPEDNYKLQDAVELAEKKKLDVFSYNNPNEIIEKFAGKSKAKPINPDTVELFVKDESKTNDEYGITEYVVEDTREGQDIVRKVVDTHFGPKSNPWCLCARDKNRSMEDAWGNWERYSDGPKRIVFQNGKLIAFYANGQYWDRMDNDTDAPVVTRKKGNVTEKIELVPVGKGKVSEFVMERRTVSQDKKTVTTEYIAETKEYEAGSVVVENRVNGVTVEKTTSRPAFDIKGNDIMQVVEVVNFDKKGKTTSNKNFEDGELIAVNVYGRPFGETKPDQIVKEKGDQIELMVNESGVKSYFAESLVGSKIAEIGFQLGKNVTLESLIKTSPDGKVRLDLNKVVEADPNAKLVVPGVSPENLSNIQFSKNMSNEFNELLERTTGVEARKRFSEAQAKIRGKKGRYKGIIPASAQDFLGLLYNFMGKGKQGDADMAFFKKALIDPFARGIDELNASRQAASNDYKNLTKQFPKVKKRLNKKAGDTGFTNDQAVRVYLWIKAGFEVPGLSNRDLAALNAYVKNDPELQAFADALGVISKKAEGYAKPGEYWLVENIISDLTSDGAIGEVRAEFLAEWQQNVDQIFSEQNLNKIEAIYGSKFREALEDILYRMKTGRNRSQGGGRLMNNYMNWVNNSVGAIMFFNIRSAVLQTISATNYINWSDNNPLKAAMAFANQKQFWSDFVMLFNSDYLKQRRTGNRRSINEAEITSAVMGVGPAEQAKAALRYLLKIGFLPTQIADSFAIASGGASFYRNRVNSYLKQGMSVAEAEQQAFLDFQETTEVSQQSARPDMISQQQANPLGRLILSFQNTPMQYARIMNKAARDIVNGRGDFKTHVSKIIYYGAIQSIIFGALQSAIFASLGDDEEEDLDTKKQRLLNQMIDSVLSGIGYGGKAISTVKNATMEYLKQRDKGFRADHAYTILQLLGFSPPIGSKLRKIYQSIQTEKFNKDVFTRRGLTLDNPIWQAIGYTVEGFFNVPLGRLSQKMYNIDNALDSNNEWWERIALIMGWNTWDLGIKDADIEGIKEEIKEEKKEEKKKEKEEKKKEKVRKKYPNKTDKQIEEAIIIEEKTKQIFDLNKTEQVKILEANNLDPKKYPKEEDRVNIILKLREKNKSNIDSTLTAIENYVPSKSEQRSIDLFKMNKKDQVNMLIDFGLSPKQIKELKYEEDRVNKIIELENKKKSKKEKK